MIEINLIPDVKRELLKTNRIKNTIISISTLIGIVAIGITVLLAVIVYVWQAVDSGLADNDIKKEFKTLSERKNVSEVLTVQDQLNKLAAIDDERYAVSRVFGILGIILPTGDNAVKISELRYDKESKTVSFDGQATIGFEAVEVLKKTIGKTTYEYTEDNQTQSGDLVVGEVNITEQSKGENSDGKPVVRFGISFVIDEKVLLAKYKTMKIIGPNKQNVTDSFMQIPNDIFTPQATTPEAGGQK
jgi:hypothetical protein